MKVLMSAFSCGPGIGSEPGVGWNFAVETAKLGHEVVVLTQTEFKDRIDKELASGSLPGALTFDVFMPRWLEALRDAGLKAGFMSSTWHAVHLLWQFAVLGHVRRAYQGADFDLVHHVTYAMIRHPTLLGRLGYPLVLGPLGGGGRAPMALRKSFGFFGWCAELLRDAHNALLRWDPITRRACGDARLIFTRCPETKAALPQSCHSRTLVDLGIGIDMTPVKIPPRREPGEPLRLVFAGRLVDLKGVHLAVRALARARADGADATLTIAGPGAQGSLRRLADRLAVAPYVTWLGAVPREELISAYGRHHGLLFPSLRDAGGAAVLEALASGLPVICLALGGPGQMVDATCGRSISIEGLDEEACVDGLARAITAFARDEALRAALGLAALERARAYAWPRVVAGVYDKIADALRSPSVDSLLRSSAEGPEHHPIIRVRSRGRDTGARQNATRTPFGS